MLRDWRGPDDTGWTLRGAALVGFKRFVMFEDDGPHDNVNAVATLDWTYWGYRHFGLTLQAAAGALVLLPSRITRFNQVLPDVRLSIGLSF